MFNEQTGLADCCGQSDFDPFAWENGAAINRIGWCHWPGIAGHRPPRIPNEGVGAGLDLGQETVANSGEVNWPARRR